MITLAADFWPLLWTLIGAGALLTALLCLLTATFSPAWFGTRHTFRPAVPLPGRPARPSRRHHHPRAA